MIATEEGTMSYGIMLRRLNKDDGAVRRAATQPVAPAEARRAGQTPVGIVLAGLYEPTGRQRRRAV